MEMDSLWSVLNDHAERLSHRHLRELFAKDAERASAMTVEGAGLVLDYSKEKLDAGAMEALLDLARGAGVEAARDALFRGEIVNPSEGRPALHPRVRADDPPAEIAEERARMLAFAEQVRADEGIEAVINLGIGGSDLGPAMATQALTPWADGPAVHYVSNVDGAHFADCVRSLDPGRTLVIVASKSFRTLETQSNADLARAWLGEGAGDRMIAVTAKPDLARSGGIAPERIFRLWDGVGGRFSVWSSVGLPLAIAIGREAFGAFLSGAAAMDDHHADAPLERNLPVLLALIGVWRRDVLGHPAFAVLPYDQRLARFPAYLQQLEMESNGKSVTLDGEPVPRDTVAVLFGEPGTNSQHSFFQMLHQGTSIVPADFLVAAEPVAADAGAHRILAASAIAQSAALAFGRSDDALGPERQFAGDRPSTTILYRRMDPTTLGALIALYEHKVSVQATLWGINPYDQFGVELGKELTSELMQAWEAGDLSAFDSSTAALVARMKALSA